MAKTLEEFFPHKFGVGDTVKVVARGESEWCKIGDTHKVRVCRHDHEDGAVYVVDDDDESAYIRECNLELVERDRQKGGEWKRHRGGKQPVADGVMVDVKLNDGTQRDGEFAEHWEWRKEDADPRITQYRVISQPQEEEVEMIHSQESLKRVEINLMKHSALGAIADSPAEAKTDYFDGPLVWRDTVNELDAYIEEFTRERDELIERLASEGFALIPPVVSVISEFSGVDMSDWRNWQKGDIVEVILENDADLPVGRTYAVKEIESPDYGYGMPVCVWSGNDDGDYHWPEDSGNNERLVFKFIRRQ